MNYRSLKRNLQFPPSIEYKKVQNTVILLLFLLGIETKWQRKWPRQQSNPIITKYSGRNLPVISDLILDRWFPQRIVLRVDHPKKRNQRNSKKKGNNSSQRQNKCTLRHIRINFQLGQYLKMSRNHLSLLKTDRQTIKNSWLLFNLPLSKKITMISWNKYPIKPIKIGGISFRKC